MGLYQRRRPSPIKIAPDHVRREDEAASGAAAESPKSPESPKDSPSTAGAESPSPKSTSFPAKEAPPPPKTQAPSQVSSSAPPAAVTSQASKPPPPPPPPASSSTKAQQQASSSAAPSTQVSSAQASSSASPPTATSRSSAQASSAPIAQITSGSSAAASSAPAIQSTGVSNSQTQRNRPNPDPSKATAVISSAATSPAQSELAGPPQRSSKQNGAIMSTGAEAALITCAALGFVALLVGAFIFFKRRRRRRAEFGMRHAEDAFDPSNSGSLHAPETAHFAAFATPEPHMTQSSTSSNDVFGAAHYQRPETASTNENRSRIVPPQPTPNPFADPPLNKAYDQLRGRPRSTTLTDRGSWIKNPFKDPRSERFDPFGELQEKARNERVKYMEDARREEADRRMREREQQFLEKERMGLGVPQQGRKGSDVTVEGLGVLDRSGNGRYR